MWIQAALSDFASISPTAPPVPSTYGETRFCLTVECSDTVFEVSTKYRFERIACYHHLEK
jgi:hypothetical protein